MFEDFTASQKRRNLNYVFPPQFREPGRPLTEHHLREAHARAHDPEAVFGRALKDPAAIRARRVVNDETDVVNFVQISILEKHSATLRRHSLVPLHHSSGLFLCILILSLADGKEALQRK